MAEPPDRPWKSALIAAVVLGVFAVLGTTLVGVAHVSTAARIEQNERQMLLAQLNAILPPDQYDNALLEDYIDVRAPATLGAQRTRVYRARREGKPVAVILSPVTGQGYSGGIRLIVGIRQDGTLSGVRVLSHKETPGLGDKIEVRKSPWILGFAGLSLNDPSEERWAVRRDGGVFDQFTGATISPRTVVKAVKKALIHYRSADRAQLFETPSIHREQDDG